MEKWYSKGLKFECTGCGKCCTGGPGVVWVNEEELNAMANFLQISREEFREKYTRKIGNKTSLKEVGKEYDCIFLKDKKCTVYGARPTQCKTYPWWPHNLKSKEEWENLKTECEGINDNAPLVPFEKIEEERLIQIKSRE